MNAVLLLKLLMITEASVLGSATEFPPTGLEVNPQFGLVDSLETYGLEMNALEMNALAKNGLETNLPEKNGLATFGLLDPQLGLGFATPVTKHTAYGIPEALTFETEAAPMRGDSYTLGFSARGSEPDANRFFLNGAYVTGPDGELGIRPNRPAVGRIGLDSGATSAVYGWTHGGIVDIRTLPASPDLHVGIEAVSDHAFGSGFDQNWYSGYVTGSLANLPDLGFAVNFERRWLGDRRPSSVSNEIPGNPGFTPANWLDGASFHGRADWNPQRSTQVRFTFDDSRDEWSEYNQAYLFNLDHVPYAKQEGRSFSLEGWHQLTPDVGLQLRGAHFAFESFRGDGAHREDLTAYDRPNGNPLYDSFIPLFWLDGHVWDDYLRRRLDTWEFAASASVDWRPGNTMDIGGEFRRFSFRSYYNLFPTRVGSKLRFDIDRFGYDELGREIEDEDGINGVRHPVEAALYAQDRFDWRDVAMLLGLRLETFDPGAPRLRDPEFPLGEDRVQLEEEDLVDTGSTTHLSPRARVEWDPDGRTPLSFAYSRYYGRAALSTYHFGESFLAHKARTGGYFYTFGNPDLKPEDTDYFELGVARRVSNRADLSVTAYIKRIGNRVRPVAIPSSPNSYVTYRNLGDSEVEGLTVKGSVTPMTGIDLSASYSLTSVTETIPTTTTGSPWNDGEASGSLDTRGDHEREHQFVATAGFSLGSESGPEWFGRRLFADTQSWIAVRATSGLPYTPLTETNLINLGRVFSESAGPVNSETAGSLWIVDLSFEKRIEAGSFAVTPFLWVGNLLDRENPVQVWATSGEPGDSGWLETDVGRQIAESHPEPDEFTGLNYEQQYRVRELEPNHYGAPRQVFLGLRIEY